ncbi:MAG: uroporphyrinogen decarboxylase [Rhodobiaceae bacterium]|nr:uroporphyrinogen decarboxylase [Rhodobiaceae bacterium]MCC0055443.1 uroporphyrinogen decarboxylase [Rhodobiaceae bacterium]
MGKALIDTLKGQGPDRMPVWFMRQAGRYLPEYRALRAKAGGFLDLCYSPEMATEVTLQPIRRFGFDAAILFSDILVIPHALGLDLSFAEGEGPLLEKADTRERVERLSASRVESFLQPVIETVSILSRELPRDVALIGFCGAPWTVASYMVAGRGTPDQAPIREMSYRDPELLDRIIDILVEASAKYLKAQLRAGAECVQIFDTWAGVVADGWFERWVIGPTKRIVDAVRIDFPDAIIIGFPKGCSEKAGIYASGTGVNAVGLDWTAGLGDLGDEFSAVSQGNLDPLVLLAGGKALDDGVDRILGEARPGRHVFNLGHGILQQTPIAHVEQVLRRLGR